MVGLGSTLVEGLQLLQAYDHSFHVFTNEGKARYSYHLIEKTLTSMGWSFHMHQILQMIVFDSIIGNQDRHQENWGFVISLSRKSPSIKEVTNILAISQKGYSFARQGLSEYVAYRDMTFNLTERFAPIYDSGSSLGRELTDAKIHSMLKDSNQLESYINRGKSEIRWKNKKVSHFELVSYLIKDSGYIWIDELLKEVILKYNETRLFAILDALDQDIPESFKEYKLSEERKTLILKLVTLRVKRLSELL